MDVSMDSSATGVFSNRKNCLTLELIGAGRNNRQHDPESGQTDWEQNSASRPISANQQVIVCQLMNDNQQAGGQQQDVQNASGQSRIHEERNTNICLQQVRSEL